MNRAPIRWGSFSSVIVFPSFVLYENVSRTGPQIAEVIPSHGSSRLAGLAQP